MKTMITTFYLIFLSMIRLSAETEIDNELISGEDKRSVFRTTCLGDWNGPKLFVQEGKRWEPIEVLDMGLSRPIHFSRHEPIKLARKAVVEAKETFVPVLSVTVPENCLSPLILMGTKQGNSIQTFVIDIDAKNFPYGSYKLVNFMPKTVTAQFGNNRFALETGQTKLVPRRKNKDNRLPIMVVLSHGTKDSKVLYSNMVLNRPNKRMIMFLQPTHGGNPSVAAQVRSLVDFKQEK